eukprot:120768-Alexandrium_andersonii.AAC.1
MSIDDLRHHRKGQHVPAFTPSPLAGSLQMWKSTRTHQSLGLGLQMVSSTRPNFRKASRHISRPSRTSRSKRTSKSATGLHIRSRTSPQCDGFTFRPQYLLVADLSQPVLRSTFPTRT